VKCLKLPAHSPNLNAYAERFVLSIKTECLGKIVPLGERHLRLVLSEYVEHYHTERNHQGLDGRLLAEVPLAEKRDDRDPVVCRQRLGGLLNYYHRGEERLAA
jgi:transposase InsO family protein